MKLSKYILTTFLAISVPLFCLSCLPISETSTIIDGNSRSFERNSPTEDASPEYTLRCIGDETNGAKLYCSITETRNCTKTVVEETDQKQVTEKKIKPVYQLLEYLGGVALITAGAITIADAPNVPDENDPTTENPLGRNGAYAVGVGGVILGAALFITGVVDSVRAKDEEIDLPPRSRDVSNDIFLCSDKMIIPEKVSIVSVSNQLELSTDGPEEFPISIDLSKYISHFCPSTPSDRFYITSQNYKIDSTDILGSYCNKENQKQAQLSALEKGKKQLDQIDSYIDKGDFLAAYNLWFDLSPIIEEQIARRDSQRTRLLVSGIDYCIKTGKDALNIDIDSLLAKLSAINNDPSANPGFIKCRNALLAGQKMAAKKAEQERQKALLDQREAEKSWRIDWTDDGGNGFWSTITGNYELGDDEFEAKDHEREANKKKVEAWKRIVSFTVPGVEISPFDFNKRIFILSLPGLLSIPGEHEKYITFQELPTLEGDYYYPFNWAMQNMNRLAKPKMVVHIKSEDKAKEWKMNNLAISAEVSNCRLSTMWRIGSLGSQLNGVFLKGCKVVFLNSSTGDVIGTARQ
jgi:hypothetical protein